MYLWVLILNCDCDYYLREKVLSHVVHSPVICSLFGWPMIWKNEKLLYFALFFLLEFLPIISVGIALEARGGRLYERLTYCSVPRAWASNVSMFLFAFSTLWSRRGPIQNRPKTARDDNQFHHFHFTLCACFTTPPPVTFQNKFSVPLIYITGLLPSRHKHQITE